MTLGEQRRAVDSGSAIAEVERVLAFLERQENVDELKSEWTGPIWQTRRSTAIILDSRCQPLEPH